MHVLNRTARGLLALLLIAVVASAAIAARVHRDMRESRLAEIDLTTKLDLKIVEEIGGIIDKVEGRTARVYLLEGDADQLRARGFSVIWIRDEAKEYGRALWDSTRHSRNPLDDYHTNDEIESLFSTWQSLYPNLFSYESIGLSVQNRDIWACKLSDNVTADEAEIEIKYISNMHGDEVVGKENCLRFIEEILTTYTSVPDYAELLADFEMWFIPLMNPDGMAAVTRYNANGVDLNRDFPDRCEDSVNTTAGRAVETGLVMNWSAQHNFVLSANFHGGALVVNYPWDTNCNGGSYVYTPSPEDCLFVKISRRYCEANPRMRSNTAFMYPDTGITNGVYWYEAVGAMQDWNYVWMGGKEVTIELDNTKWPASSRLESLWQENRLAMRYYLLEARYGVRGVVTDSITGLPVRANIQLGTIPYLTFSSAFHGEYYRVMWPGTYSLTYSAPGYASKTVTGVVVPSQSYVTVNVQLAPVPAPNITVDPDSLHADVLACSDTDVPFAIHNTGVGTLTWSAAETYQQETHYGNAVGGGWRWIDSDQAGGPVYQWVDINTIGTAVTFASDDQNLGPFALGFSFPFYGTNFTTYRLCGNGWISFTNTTNTWSNRNLPSTEAPENLIAPWWDDLSPQRTGTIVRRWTNNVDSAIISFSNVQSYSGSGVYNFQIILLASGKIIFQYGSMGSNRLNESTIGFQNSTMTMGEAVIYNALYIHNNMAISFCPSSYLQIIPSSGNIAPGGTLNATARVYSCCLPTIASGSFTISSNDLDTPSLIVPVSMEIVVAPPEDVQDLVVIPAEDGVHLYWSASNFATGYYVYRMTDAGQDYTAGTLLTPTPVTTTNFVDTTLPPETLICFYQVIATR